MNEGGGLVKSTGLVSDSHLWAKTLVMNLVAQANIENRLCGMVLPTQ